MLAHSRHGARLRSVIAFVLGHDEPHFGTGLELVEAWLGHGIAVEIDLLAFRGLDEAVTFLGEKADDLAMERDAVALDVAALFACPVLQKAPDGVKGIADCDVDILMGVVLAAFMGHGDFSAWNHHFDANAVKLALLLMPMGRLDDDPATHDARVEAIEPLGPLSDCRLDGRRRPHLAKANLNRKRHVALLTFICSSPPDLPQPRRCMVPWSRPRRP